MISQMIRRTENQEKSDDSPPASRLRICNFFQGIKHFYQKLMIFHEYLGSQKDPHELALYSSIGIDIMTHII